MKKFALYTKKMLDSLPHWFKIKKNPQESIGASFLNIIGLEMDELRHILEYAYEQNKVSSLDEKFTDIIYKTFIPDEIQVSMIEDVLGNSVLLHESKTLDSFLSVNLNKIENPELYIDDLYFIDKDRKIIYVKEPYAKNKAYKDGKISIKVKDAPDTVTLSLALHHVWNFLDEFGLLVECQRLYGENNYSYKTRILDVFKNPGGANREGLLNAIARELNTRRYITWSTPNTDLIIKSPMVTLNSITVDDVKIDLSDLYIDNLNYIVLKGKEEWAGTKKTVSYITGIEMHQLHNKNDEKLQSELYNFDGSPRQLLKSYAEKIHAANPIKWGKFKWNESYWDSSSEETGGLGFIATLYDGKIDGFMEKE